MLRNLTHYIRGAKRAGDQELVDSLIVQRYKYREYLQYMKLAHNELSTTFSELEVELIVQYMRDQHPIYVTLINVQVRCLPSLDNADV